LYDALAVTLAMLLRLINCRFFISIYLVRNVLRAIAMTLYKNTDRTERAQTGHAVVYYCSSN